jgi:hypothetical protein
MIDSFPRPDDRLVLAHERGRDAGQRRSTRTETEAGASAKEGGAPALVPCALGSNVRMPACAAGVRVG